MDEHHPGAMPALKHLRLDCKCCGRFLLAIKDSVVPIEGYGVTCNDCGEEYRIAGGKAIITQPGTPMSRQKRDQLQRGR